MLQLDAGLVVRYMPLFAFVLIIGAVLLFIVVENSSYPENKGKFPNRLLLENYFHLEVIIQLLFIVGVFMLCIPSAFIVDDIVLSIDMTIFPFVILPMFILGFHYRMKHFKDVAEGNTTDSPGVTFESLKPTIYARITLIYWIGSMFSLIYYFALINSGSSPEFTAVFLHYGLGGLLIFSSPLLLSLGSLRRKSTEI